MKKMMKFLGLFLMVTAVTVSCSDDNDPVDDDVFVGTYRGAISYVEPDSDTSVSIGDGEVNLVKVGDTYNFRFSDGIPNLTGIKIEKNENVFVSPDGAISIDEGNLVIAYTEDGETWTADCER